MHGSRQGGNRVYRDVVAFIIIYFSMHNVRALLKAAFDPPRFLRPTRHLNFFEIVILQCSSNGSDGVKRHEELF
jgi:hypothetical protein